MSAVITNIYDLEFVWRKADDGFSSGADFKTWLANTVIRQCAELADLRDDSLQLIGANRLLSEIGAALNCAPDATILDSIAALRSQVALLDDYAAPALAARMPQ